MNKLLYRKATINDLDLLFNWVNDPIVRKNSFQSKNITYIEHKNWFISSLSNINCAMYIFYRIDDNTPVGQLRFNFLENKAEINYSIDKKFRGNGYGTQLIKITDEILSKYHPETWMISAKVKNNNIPSQQVFLKNKYQILTKNNEYTNYFKIIKRLF